MKEPLRWVPLYVDPWIFGSSRHELTRAQRSDFIDLLLLSAKDSGYLRANETMGYPIAQLAGLLCVQPEELEETISRCIEVGKLERRENGILYVVNWERYKLTPQYRRRLKSGPSSDSSSENREEKREEEERKGKGNTLSEKGNVVSQKGNMAPSPSVENGNEEDGLFLIPEGLPFEAKDELVQRRAEIRRIQRLLSTGKCQDGIRRISVEGLEAMKVTFNERVKDFLG